MARRSRLYVRCSLTFLLATNTSTETIENTCITIPLGLNKTKGLDQYHN